ncbi:MAG: insulinase family protein [Oscillospiraceae bacterium]|nr:insulinase family protein [Oscillospiraceae bacterium]
MVIVVLNMTSRALSQGVHLTALHTEKFKSSFLSIQLLAPLSANTASRYALLPPVLRRGTARYPDMQSLSAALDALYGGSIDPFVRKQGGTQLLSLVGTFLDDAYTGGERLLEPFAALMGDMLLHPVLEKRCFRPDYFESEKRNLINEIKGQVNEKRRYAKNRVIEEMCAGEPFGVHELGTAEAAGAVSLEGLCSAYRELLETAGVELFYCGSAEPARVEEALRTALQDLPEGKVRYVPASPQQAGPPQAPRFVEEKLDVTQGKLTMGFRTGVTMADAQYPALVLLNAVYGGTATSKLFMHVREELSLCYYASSSILGTTGLMLVNSGIEFAQFERAKEEILRQLQACRDGDFDADELEGARRAAVSACRSLTDSLHQLEDYWLKQVVAGGEEPPEAFIARLEAVTRDEVIACARNIQLDTVYFLNGKEA